MCKELTRKDWESLDRTRACVERLKIFPMEYHRVCLSLFQLPCTLTSVSPVQFLVVFLSRQSPQSLLHTNVLVLVLVLILVFDYPNTNWVMIKSSSTKPISKTIRHHEANTFSGASTTLNSLITHTGYLLAGKIHQMIIICPMIFPPTSAWRALEPHIFPGDGLAS